MGRAPCCEKVGLKKGKWTEEEDEILTNYINAHGDGEGSWKSLPKKAGLLRCGKSCRLRWINYLRAGLKRGNFSRDEEELIIKLHHSLGNRWSQIASELPGRTDNDIKNYWNSHLSRSIHNYHQLNICKNTVVESMEPLLKSSNKNSDRNSAKITQTTTKKRKKKIVGKALNPPKSSIQCNEEIASQISSLSDEALGNNNSDCFNRPLSPKLFDNFESEPIKVSSEISFTADECSMSISEIINGPSSPDLSSIFNEMDNLLKSEIDETNVEHGDKNMLGDIMDDLLVQIEVGKEEEGCLGELNSDDFLWDSDVWSSMRFVEDELVLD